MDILEKVFGLSKKLSDALLNKEALDDLEESDLFSEDAKIHIKQQLTDKEINEHLLLLNEIDKEDGWAKLQSAIPQDDFTKSKERNNISHFYKLAASVLLSFSIGYWLVNNRTNEAVEEKVNEVIQIGSSKATLTIEDGTNITLEKGKVLNRKDVVGDGEKLIYKQTEASEMVYNILTIPRGGQYQIILSDSTKVWLNSATQLRYPVTFKEGEPRNIELVYGEAFFEVSKSNYHGGDAFKVHMRDQEIEVLGTSFNIKAYEDDDSIYTTLVEGKVILTVGDEQKEFLKPGEQTILHLPTRIVTKSNVDVDQYIAWVRGYFNFKDKPLQEIMKVLSRWYDVDVVFESSGLKRVTFNGLLNKKQNITDILDAIQTTKFINAYEINDKTITIR